jgi:hypothetical protein
LRRMEADDREEERAEEREARKRKRGDAQTHWLEKFMASAKRSKTESTQRAAFTKILKQMVREGVLDLDK